MHSQCLLVLLALVVSRHTVLCLLYSLQYKNQVQVLYQNKNGTFNEVSVLPVLNGNEYCTPFITDVNNDGIDDFIVGSTGANQFNGLSHVIYGSENLSPSLSLSDLNSANAFIIIGENTNGGSSGRFVSSAGDLNNDGTSDIIISAPIYNKSYVVLSNDVIYSNGFE